MKAVLVHRNDGPAYPKRLEAALSLRRGVGAPALFENARRRDDHGTAQSVSRSRYSCSSQWSPHLKPSYWRAHRLLLGHYPAHLIKFDRRTQHALRASQEALQSRSSICDRVAAFLSMRRGAGLGGTAARRTGSQGEAEEIARARKPKLAKQ